jgi:hypothetical protein
MKILRSLYLAVITSILALPLASSAHYIIGIVNNATDGMSANNHQVVLWNPAVGINDNLTDTIGPTGNSGTSNIYMIDCEMLSSPCGLNDFISVKVINNNDGYASLNTTLAVTGAGYDLANNLTLLSPPNITSVLVDDSFEIPSGEIDLTPNDTRRVYCRGNVINQNGEGFITSSRAELYHISSSGYSFPNDNNNHYANNSCYLNFSYGNENQLQVICGFDLLYYSSPGAWRCFINITSNLSVTRNNSGDTNVNTLLAISAQEYLNFSEGIPNEVSDEANITIVNYGNVAINLSLYGYGVSRGDNYSMNCSSNNISISLLKFNFTKSNPGTLTFSQFESRYINLTSTEKTRRFNLNSRQDDVENEAVNSTFWRIFVPVDTRGNCTGEVVISALSGPET